MMGESQSVFVDTVALLVLANQDDQLHEQCQRIWREKVEGGMRFVTSDWVLAEFLNGASRPPLRQAACRIVDRLRRSVRTTIIAASRDLWDRAFELFRSRQDKEWSFVDCASILICQEVHVDSVFTRDRHFVQAGFKILVE